MGLRQGPVTQPPRAAPLYNTSKGRHSLKGLPLNEALVRLRGYGVTVVYPGDPTHIVLYLDKTNVVVRAK